MSKDRPPIKDSVYWYGFFAGIWDKPKITPPLLSALEKLKWELGWEYGQEQRKPEVRICPKCKSAYWDKAKKVKENG